MLHLFRTFQLLVFAAFSRSAGWNPSQFVALITGRTRRSATWMLSIARVAVSYTQYTPEYAKVGSILYC